MNKPFHLMTPAERTAARIAQNRAISEKFGETQEPEAPGPFRRRLHSSHPRGAREARKHDP